MKKDVSDFYVGDYITGRSVSEPRKYFTVLNRKNEYSDIYGEAVGNMCGDFEYYPNDDNEPFCITNNIKLDYATLDEIRHLDRCIAADKYVFFEESLQMFNKGEVYCLNNKQGAIFIFSPCSNYKLEDYIITAESISSINSWNFTNGNLFINSCDLISKATEEQKKQFYRAKFDLKTDKYYKYIDTDLSGNVKEVYFKPEDPELNFNNLMGIGVDAEVKNTDLKFVYFHFYDGNRTIQEVTEAEYNKYTNSRTLYAGVIYSINDYIVCLDETSFDATEQTKGLFCTMSCSSLTSNFSRDLTQIVSLANGTQIAKYEELLALKRAIKKPDLIVANPTIKKWIEEEMASITPEEFKWVLQDFPSDSQPTKKKQSTRTFKVFTNKNK